MVGDMTSCLKIAFEQATHVGAGVMQAAHHRAFGTLEGLGDIFVAHAFDLAQKDHGTMIFGKATDRGPDLFSEFFVVEGAYRIFGGEGANASVIFGGVVEVMLKSVVVVEGLVLSFAADKVNTKVDHDPIHPCVEARVPLKIAEITVGFQEGFLDDIEGIFGVVEHSISCGEEFFLVALDKAAKSFFVAITAALDECVVVKFHVGAPQGGKQGGRLCGCCIHLVILWCKRNKQKARGS